MPPISVDMTPAVTKVDSATILVVTPQPNKQEPYTIGELLQKRDLLQAKLDAVNNLIAQAKTLGVQ